MPLHAQKTVPADNHVLEDRDIHTDNKPDFHSGSSEACPTLPLEFPWQYPSTALQSVLHSLSLNRPLLRLQNCQRLDMLFSNHPPHRAVILLGLINVHRLPLSPRNLYDSA